MAYSTTMARQDQSMLVTAFQSIWSFHICTRLAAPLGWRPSGLGGGGWKRRSSGQRGGETPFARSRKRRRAAPIKGALAQFAAQDDLRRAKRRGSEAKGIRGRAPDGEARVPPAERLTKLGKGDQRHDGSRAPDQRVPQPLAASGDGFTGDDVQSCAAAQLSLPARLGAVPPGGWSCGDGIGGFQSPFALAGEACGTSSPPTAWCCKMPGMCGSIAAMRWF